MPRAAYWMVADERGLTERRASAGSWETLGLVEEAPYLAHTGRSWLARLFGAPPTLSFVLPFDQAGRDVLELFDHHAAVLDGDDDPIGVVRRCAGRVVCLSPRETGDRTVVRDLWVDGPRPRRIVDGVHFGLQPLGGAPIAVAFAQSPLVLGPPLRRRVSAHLPDLVGVLPGSAIEQLMGPETGELLEIREGDTVEVLGVTWDPERCEGRFELHGRTASYREMEAPLRLAIGDAPGLRLVIRVLVRAP